MGGFIGLVQPELGIPLVIGGVLVGSKVGMLVGKYSGKYTADIINDLVKIKRLPTNRLMS